MSPCCSLWPLRCQKHSGTETSIREKNWMGGCFPEMIGMIENHKFPMFFLALEEQNRFTAQPKRTLLHLSHTPANRNECPYCKHFLTSPTNTSILSLSLKNHNFKFVTLKKGRWLPCLPKGDPKGDWSNMISLAGEQLIQQLENKFALNNVIVSTAAGCMGRFPALGLQHYQMSNRLDHRFSKLGEIHQTNTGTSWSSWSFHMAWNIIMIVHVPFLKKSLSFWETSSKVGLASHHSRPVASSQCRRKGLTRHGGTVASPHMVIQPGMTT